MDTNRLRFWTLANDSQWEPATENESHNRVEWHPEHRALRLTSAIDTVAQTNMTEGMDEQALRALLQNVPPRTIDRFGTYAFIEHQNGIVVAGAGPTPKTILEITNAMRQGYDMAEPTDVATGYDDILYIAADTQVALVDLRRSREPTILPLESLHAWRLCTLPSGGALVLGRVNDDSLQTTSAACVVARISGRPFVGPTAIPPPDMFVPAEPNPEPLRIHIVVNECFDGEKPMAIASNPGGKVAILFWETSGDAKIRLLIANRLSQPISLPGVRRPTSLAWLSNNRIAVIVRAGSAHRAAIRAFVIDEEDIRASEVGEYYPVSPTALHFSSGTTFPPHYDPGNGNPPAPLHPISFPSYYRTGTMQNAVDMTACLSPIDAGEPIAEWHRLYIEALVPPRCGIRVFLAATNGCARPSWNDPNAWHEHLFGHLESESEVKDVPRGAWLPVRSEIPFHDGLLRGTLEPHQKGLFTVLVQRAGCRVRTLRGRYLWVRVTLVGDGRGTPELAGLRVYGSRFSYLNQYLPEFYRESVFGTDADERAGATPSDFLERFLGIVEGILTPLEDRIANAYMLTDPRTVPEGSFDWLASFIGFTLDPLVPQARRRSLLMAAPAIRKWHGTLRGLRIALDALTDGAVSRGAIVIVEDFKLRRTFSTILGANLDRDDDPLLPGLHESGNSYVGDTLFLSDGGKKEFLALFGAEIETNATEHATITDFFDKLAHRVTILTHENLDRTELGLIRRMVELEAPAHLHVSIFTATHPFMVAVASLIGVDTFLGPPEKQSSVRLGESVLGIRDLLVRPPSLDPRLQSGKEVFG